MSRDATYGKIIAAEEFNKINNDQHLYIAASDEIIKSWTEEHGGIEVVEFGCGPARLLQKLDLIRGINLTGVDHDQDYVEYARTKVDKAKVVMSDVESYQHAEKIDVVVTQGAHHHFSKPPQYLENVVAQLSDNGIYILCDEFLPNYHTEYERRIRATIWYSHIIADAIKKGYDQLALEEAKTFLDELNTENDETRIKTPEQVELVLNQVTTINERAIKDYLAMAEVLAGRFLGQLSKIYSWEPNNDPTLDLSRGDYKICDSVLRAEIAHFGLMVEKKKSIGPIRNIGGMTIYVLKKK